MKALALVAAIAGFTACDSQQPEQPEPARTADIAPTETGVALPPPRREQFAAAWAEACPDAEPVGKALCKSKGLTDPNFTCNYALGDDEYRRHTAELAPGDGEWVLANPANACNAE